MSKNNENEGSSYFVRRVFKSDKYPFMNVYAVSRYNIPIFSWEFDNNPFTVKIIEVDIRHCVYDVLYRTKREAVEYIRRERLPNAWVIKPYSAEFDETLKNIEFYGYDNFTDTYDYFRGLSLANLGIRKGVSRVALENIAKELGKKAVENNVYILQDIKVYLVEYMYDEGWLNWDEFTAITENCDYDSYVFPPYGS